LNCSSLHVLSDSEIQDIHQCSLELLEEIGIRVHLKKMRTLLADHGFEVDEGDRTVNFPAELVEKFLKKAPQGFILRGTDPGLQWHISPETRAWVGLGTPFRMLNADGKRWDATMRDVNEHLILFEHLEHICCSQLDIWPEGIPIHIYQAEAMHSWAQHCKKPIGTGAYGVLATRDFVEMVDLVTGGGDLIKGQYPHCCIVNTHSPLTTAQMQLEGLMIFAQNNVPAIMSPEAMAGTTAPVTLAGLLVQHNAEVISHIVMAQVVNGGAPVMYGSVSNIADMRNGRPALGAVETGMLSVAAAQMAHFYGLPCRAIAGATESKIMDLQCGIEREQSMTLAAMGGVNFITSVGTLESTNQGAHELCVIDNEIIGRIERLMEGVAVNPTTLAMDAIRRVGSEGDFLKQRHTLNHIIPEHFIPSVSDRQPLETWKRGGQKGIIDHAAEKVDAILEDHQPVDLDAGLDKELDSFVERIKRRSVDDYRAAEWEG
jgi:trimethylamine--corrinoid protein Co-methyltransferase